MSFVFNQKIILQLFFQISKPKKGSGTSAQTCKELGSCHSGSEHQKLDKRKTKGIFWTCQRTKVVGQTTNPKT